MNAPPVGNGRPGSPRRRTTGALRSEVPEIVIVNGGAGGLELATRPGDKLGKRRRANAIAAEECLEIISKDHLRV